LLSADSPARMHFFFLPFGVCSSNAFLMLDEFAKTTNLQDAKGIESLCSYFFSPFFTVRRIRSEKKKTWRASGDFDFSLL